MENIRFDMSEEMPFRISVDLEKDYIFRVDFGLDKVGTFAMDEPEPTGSGLGPNASRVLAAAVGNCLAASLLFCLRRSRVDVRDLKATVEGVVARNEKGRLRMRELNVELGVAIDGEQEKQLERCKQIFEDYCIVTGSIRQGIPVNVKVISK